MLSLAHWTSQMTDALEFAAGLLIVALGVSVLVVDLLKQVKRR